MQIQVKAKPAKISRLGKYDPEKATDDKARPIKLEFANAEIKAKVISNASKLKDAPENLSNISISYDMSNEQRDQAKKLHMQAKDLSKNSTQYIYRVRGLPGKMEIKQYPKVTKKNQKS